MIYALKDPTTYIASIGMILMFAVNWIVDNVNPVLGLLAGLGGLVMIVLSIAEKIKKDKLNSLELKIKEEELKQLRERSSK